MELYTAKVMRHPKLLNPTVIVITDRTELDGQLFGAFQRSRLLPETPEQIKTRSRLRQALSERITGGVRFTTLQKFGRSVIERESGADHPMLSDRENIVVVVDESHRSHYDDLDGYAAHLKHAVPNATLDSRPRHPRQPRRGRRRVAGRPLPQAQRPVVPGLVGRVGQRDPHGAAAGGEVLRRGPRPHGQVRRRRPARKRRTDPRGHPAAAVETRRGLDGVGGDRRHLRGGRDAEAEPVGSGARVRREGQASGQAASGHRGAAQPCSPRSPAGCHGTTSSGSERFPSG